MKRRRPQTKVVLHWEANLKVSWILSRTPIYRSWLDSQVKLLECKAFLTCTGLLKKLSSLRDEVFLLLMKRMIIGHSYAMSLNVVLIRILNLSNSRHLTSSNWDDHHSPQHSSFLLRLPDTSRVKRNHVNKTWIALLLNSFAWRTRQETLFNLKAIASSSRSNWLSLKRTRAFGSFVSRYHKNGCYKLELVFTHDHTNPEWSTHCAALHGIEVGPCYCFTASQTKICKQSQLAKLRLIEHSRKASSEENKSRRNFKGLNF